MRESTVSYLMPSATLEMANFAYSNQYWTDFLFYANLQFKKFLILNGGAYVYKLFLKKLFTNNIKQQPLLIE